jgi:hypothetical protein
MSNSGTCQFVWAGAGGTVQQTSPRFPLMNPHASTLRRSGFGRRIIRKPTINASVCGSNRFIACSDESERNGTAVLGEDRHNPAIAAKTSTHCELDAPVFHRGSKEDPDSTWGSGRGSQVMA